MSNRAKSPNDPKLSDGRGWRGPCMAGGEGGGPEAGAVTATPVRCSAWLGVAVECKKTLIGEFGCWYGGLGKTSRKNLVIDVVAGDYEMAVLCRVVRKLRVMPLPVGHMLALQIGVRDAEDV